MKTVIRVAAMLASSIAFAGEMGIETLAGQKFIGIGGGYHSVRLEQQLNPLIGYSNLYSSSGLVASGSAGGPATPFRGIITTFAPEAQAGYLRDLNVYNLFAGAKLYYQYLRTVFSDDGVAAPQSGALTSIGSGIGTTFTGHAIIDSVQTRVNNELSLLALLGYSLNERFKGYAGIGPTVFSAKTYFYNVTGYADVNGSHFDVTGAPTNFSGSQWLWGAVGQIGLMYYLNPSWFIDLSYIYAESANYTKNYVIPFSNAFSAYTDIGTMNGTNVQNITDQGVKLSINWVF